MDRRLSTLGTLQAKIRTRAKSITIVTKQMLSLNRGLSNKIPLIDLTLANHQLGCSFLRNIPFEIRLLIYQYVFQSVGDVLHLEYAPLGPKDNLVLCQPCIASSAAFVQRKRGVSQRRGTSGKSSWGDAHQRCEEFATALKEGWNRTKLRLPLTLLLSCRLMYSEVIEPLYSSFTFSLIHVDSARRFLTATPSLQLNAIGSLHFSWRLDAPLHQSAPDSGPRERSRNSKRRASERFERGILLEARWEYVCQMMSTMQNLLDLQITFLPSPWEVSESRLLKPLMKITRPSNFIIELPWEYELPWEDELTEEDVYGSPPFEIRRKEMPH